MYKLFTGEELQKVNLKQRWGWGRLRGGLRSTTGRAPVIDRQVDLASIDVRNENEGNTVKSHVRLEMHNTGKSDRAEFLREIHLPVGVLITGLTLKVDEEFVPGQIFEKRAAMWVYHMIRDSTRRDPGILTYKSPFTLNETRVAEIEFQFPQGQIPAISLGDKQLTLGQENNQVNDASVMVGGANQNEVFAILSKEAMANLPRIKRQPYFHFILDSSKNGSLDANGYMERINFVMSQYPNIKMAKMTAANFDLEDLTSTPITVDVVNKIIAKSTLPHQGTLDVGRVIRQELMQYHAQRDSNWQEYPLFVLITKASMSVVPPVSEDMAFFSIYLPDCNYYLATVEPGKVDKRLLWPTVKNLEEQEVIALKSNNSLFILPVNQESMQTAYFNGNSLTREVSVYDPSVGKFVSMSNLKILPEDLSYSRGLDLVFKNYEAMTNPAEFDQKLSELVKSSRESGVMIPATSYIIVERSSQWKTLKFKEKQRLGTSEGLEFDEGINTPAPSLLVMAFLLFLLFWLKEKIRVPMLKFVRK